MEENSRQTEANKKWQKNQEHARYLRNRSTTRSFLRKQATLEDIEEMESIILERRKTLLLESE